MSRRRDRRESLYFELLCLLVLSAFISGMFFVTVNYTGDWFIRSYYVDGTYIERMNAKYIQKLQMEINQKDISSRDFQKLNLWVKKQKIISLQVYKDGNIIYDSDYMGSEPDLESAAEAYRYDWVTYFLVEFIDGEAEVSIYGAYEYQLYNYAMILELLVSFAMFLCIVMLGIRKKMKYIRILSKEIEILEGGNLDYEITISGRDELADLATGLDDMRKSFRDQVEQEIYLVAANRKIITEMSHDLKTPLTSLMLYTEILEAGKYKNEKQMHDYIEIIGSKTRRMKQLTDHLFEYALVAGKDNVQMEEVSLETAFYDLFSEICGYLEYHGFHVETNLQWTDRKICINGEYTARIFENITSNIVKYADKTEAVQITTKEQKDQIIISFCNVSVYKREKKDSTNIGIRNIKSMMERMNGRCEVNETGKEFIVFLYFAAKV